MSTFRAFMAEAQRCVHAARALNDEHNGKAMPSEVARQIEDLLEESSSWRRKANLVEHERYLNEPQYRHPMYLETEAGKGIGLDDGPVSQQTKTFLNYLRTGNLDLMRKAALVEDSTGQALVPVDYAGTIVKALAREGVLRNLAFVRPTTKDRVDVGAVAVGTPTWGRLEVTGGPPADGLAATPASSQEIVVHELTALAKVGVDELADADESLQATIRQALAEVFAQVEDDAFTGGSGTDQPWGCSHTVTQNVSAAVDNTPTPDELKTLTFAVPARFRRNGAFVGHSLVEKAVALMKDNDGNYLFQPSAAAGEPGTLFGYPWHSADGLPDPSTAGISQKSVVFGDFRAGYMIADRQRFTVQPLRELYAVEGKVGLLVKSRVGGDVIRSSALATYTL
jgi:HK97 family phage major capsid protein